MKRQRHSDPGKSRTRADARDPRLAAAAGRVLNEAVGGDALERALAVSKRGETLRESVAPLRAAVLELNTLIARCNEASSAEAVVGVLVALTDVAAAAVLAVASAPAWYDVPEAKR